MLNTISAKEIQRAYKQVFERVRREKKPLVVITNNKPVAAIISLDLLERVEEIIKLERLDKEGMREYRQGRTQSITTPQELETYLKEVEEDAR